MARLSRTTQRLLRRFMGGSTLFNGSTSKIDCGAELVGAGAATFSAWIKAKGWGEGNNGRVFDNGKLQVLINSSKKLGVSSDGSTTVYTPDNSLYLNQWVHILVTRTAAGLANFYINGVLVGTPDQSSGTPVAGNTNLFIGNNSATDRTFDGYIAEACIVPRVVTEAERYAIMNGSFPSDATNLWKLDDQPSTYLDTIGGANGTGTATVYSPDVPVQQRVLRGDYLASLWFDGVNDKITIPNASQIQFDANPFSVAVRMKIRTKGSWRVINKWDTKGWLIDTVAGGVRFRVYDGTNGRDFQPSCVLKANEWITIVATCSIANNRMRLYVNGQLIGEADVNSLSSVATAAGKNIEVGTLASSQWLPGLMKSIHLWNRELTHDEIKSLVFGNIIPRSGLVDERILNEGAGTVAYDSSGNGNHGTITGAKWSADVPSKARVTHPIGRTLHP